MRFQILITILLFLPNLPANAQYNIGSGDVSDIYEENCASCHGDGLAGGSGSSLIDDKWLYGGSDAEIAASIRNGIPDMGMPAWEGGLDEKQIRSLVIFIREKKAESVVEQVKEKLGDDDGVFTAAGQSYTLETLGEIDGLLWSIDFMPDGAMLVTQRDGAVWRILDGKPTKIEGTPKVWQHGQGGLLEVALHPDYDTNGWIYLSYSEHIGVQDGDKDAGITTVVRGRIKDDAWVDQERLFRLDKKFHTSSGAHFGSRFVFDDGYLFFSIGDRRNQDLAQELGKPNGKIFRIHDDGRIPEDNPFVDVDGALPEIWSYGHRNAQGMDRDPQTGLLWESEHGPRGGDEINVVEKGKNYGWPVITYGMNYNGTPITDKTHQEGMEQPKLHWVPSIAVAGIDFCECGAFPAWNGKLLAGGMASEELHLLTIESGEVTADEIVLKGQGRIRDVASGPDGMVYLLLNKGDPRKGKIVRMVPAG